MPDKPDNPTPRREMRETDVVKALRSTSIQNQPTAFFSTQLPVLEVALNVEMMTAKMADLLQPLAREGATPAIVYAKLLAYKQGNRGLIHYEVTGTTLGERCLVFGKLYPELNQAERVSQTMLALWSDVFHGLDEVGVPRALGCIAEFAMLVYIPVEGEILGDALDSAAALRYMDLAGTWLGALHRGKLPLDRRFNVANEMVNLQAWAALVSHKYPDQAENAARIATRLKELTAELPFETDAPMHKDFHYGHIVVNSWLKVIDFDEMRLGDPNFDLAHFCANLHLLAYRLNNSPFQFSALQNAFLSAYARVTGWQPNDRFVYFYAYTCLKIAKQLCSMRGLRPRPEGEEQQRQVQLMIAQGLGALPSATARRLSSKFETMIVEAPITPPNES
ncbi:MAG TPA: aminoglycoside phosphotransferase family protein [Roseiflexaceae bacterium]